MGGWITAIVTAAASLLSTMSFFTFRYMTTRLFLKRANEGPIKACIGIRVTVFEYLPSERGRIRTVVGHGEEENEDNVRILDADHRARWRKSAFGEDRRDVETLKTAINGDCNTGTMTRPYVRR